MESTRIPLELPPLKLHPFDSCPDPARGPQSRCSNPLTQDYLDAHYNELAMLCLIGMDLNRWLEQCVETASANPAMGGLPEGAFIAALLFAPPTPVQQKLHMWGVWNYQIIFSRAIGLNAVFPHPPHVRFEIYASGESYLERVWSE